METLNIINQKLKHMIFIGTHEVFIFKDNKPVLQNKKYDFIWFEHIK